MGESDSESKSSSKERKKMIDRARAIFEFIERLDDKYDIKEKKVYHVIHDIKQESFMATEESISLLGIA